MPGICWEDVPLIELVAMAAMSSGAGLVAIAGLGLLRLPDLYTRMHAVTKATTLGLALLLLASALEAWRGGVFPMAELLVVVFVFLTNPVGVHLLARAAYLSGLPMSAGSFDEMGLAGRAVSATHDRD